MDFSKKISILFLAFLISSSAAFADSISESDTKKWLKDQLHFSLQKINKNILTQNDERGAIIAAIKTNNAPNYYFHWVRDAGLTIISILNVYPSLKREDKEIYGKAIWDYVDFSSRIQKTYTLADLGEPKFNVDGSAVHEPWSRPQNDGPATRAISLIQWANILLAEGKKDEVSKRLYNSKLPAESPIKMDLEYVSHHWKDPTYDVWEEVQGTHFYTLMLERRALLEGAKLARKLKDDGAADWYYKQGKAIEVELGKFVDPKQKMIIPTINRTNGVDYKTSDIDTAVILGLLYGDINDNLFRWDDPVVANTLVKIIQSFGLLYPINQSRLIPGVAIGRYPEDRYSGTDFNGGNPWPLCTLAVAEGLYRYSAALVKKGNKKVAQEMSQLGDQLVERVRAHAHKDGSLNEQIDRNTGYMTSVSDLTWNYAALLFAREAVLKR